MIGLDNATAARVGVLEDRIAEAQFVAEVDAWLRTQTKPELPVHWLPRGLHPMAVRNTLHLTELISSLTTPGAWAVLERPGKPGWTQTMRVDDGWIVEVDGGTGPDAFARRVRQAKPGISPTTSHKRRSGNTAPGSGTSYFPDEPITSPGSTAHLMWAWLHGELPGAYALRDLTDGVD